MTTHRLRSTALSLAAFALSLAARTAEAACDLSVSMSQPSNVSVYQSARYTVRVTNLTGSTSARGTLTIQLPRTHTSPTVYVLGTVGAFTTGCTRSGTQITCGVSQLRRGNSQDFFVDLTLPQHAGPVEITATVAVTGDSAPNNNQRTLVADLQNPDFVIPTTSDRSVQNRHCTGQALTSFLECTLFPSSIATHATVYRPDGSISIPDAPDYTGQWWQPFADQLAFTYSDGSATVAQFVGSSVGGGCFEGITSFPNSTYVSPYRVCVAP